MVERETNKLLQLEEVEECFFGLIHLLFSIIFKLKKKQLAALVFLLLFFYG